MSLQAELHRTPYNPATILSQIRSTLFPNLNGQIGVLFARDKTLANIRYNSSDEIFPAVITINSILNHPNTPIEVISHILTHELLHLEIFPRTIENKKTYHPPEFWEKEKLISQNSSHTMAWVYLHFHHYIKVDKENERITVKKSAFNALYSSRLLGFKEFVEEYGGRPRNSEEPTNVC